MRTQQRVDTSILFLSFLSWETANQAWRRMWQLLQSNFGGKKNCEGWKRIKVFTKLSICWAQIRHTRDKQGICRMDTSKMSAKNRGKGGVCGVEQKRWTLGAYIKDGHEFEQTPGDGEGQGSLACCSPWGHKELDLTERLSNNNKGWASLG